MKTYGIFFVFIFTLFISEPSLAFDRIKTPPAPIRNETTSSEPAKVLIEPPTEEPKQITYIDGLPFDDIYEDEGVVMSLKGVGRKWVLFMKVFAAGFYLQEGVSVDNVLENVSKRIEVSYYHPIPGKKLSKYTKSKMKENLSIEEYKSVLDKIDLMGEYFVDLKPGDHYSLTYMPEVGTKFSYNGKLVGVIEGEIFARGLFSVWVGKRPMDRRIKKQILGLDKIAMIKE